jgi:hypothetical protein
VTAHNYTNTASNAALDAPLNSSASSFAVTTFTGYPAVPFFILVDRDTSSAELMEVTGVAGTTLTVVRGAGGTASTSHSSGATVEHVIPAAVPQAVEQHIEATTNVHGVTGALVGADSTGTLANKTFRGAHTHVYSDTLPDSPSAGFLVSADNSVARDGFVANNTGANADRNAFVSRQSGSDRVNIFYDGTVKVTPSGAASRPAIETTGNVKAENFESTDDITAAGDITAIGNIEGANGNFGNLNVSGNLSSTNANAFGTVTAAGTIQANAAGTGLTVANTAEVGTLNVTNGDVALLGSGAKLQFPASVASPGTPGTAQGQVRYRARGLEVWGGATWYKPGDLYGYGTQTSGYSTGTISDGTAHPILIQNYTGATSGAPYYLMCQGQCEINNVSDGSTRFDLTARLDSAGGTVIATGLGNGYTQTGVGFTARLTGDHDVYWVIQRTLGSGSCQITAFNGQFTSMSFGATAAS